MKKVFRSMICVLLAAALLAGCSRKPTAEDAKEYLQAVMDYIVKGDYDHKVRIVDFEDFDCDEMIAGMIGEYADGVFSDEAKEKYFQFINKAFDVAKYNVTDAVKTGDGGYMI